MLYYYQGMNHILFFISNLFKIICYLVISVIDHGYLQRNSKLDIGAMEHGINLIWLKENQYQKIKATSKRTGRYCRAM